MQLDRIGKEIVHFLSWDVRLLSESQIGHGWKLSADAAASRARRLVNNEMLQTATVRIRVLQPATPIVSWLLGDADPNAEKLAWRLKSRWANCLPTTERIYWATSRAKRAFGGVTSGLRQPLQIEHDLVTTHVALTMKPALSSNAHWMGEDAYRCESCGKRIRAIPDAFIVDEQRCPTKAIEIGGRYATKRLKKLHQSFKTFQLAYELW